MKRAITVAVVGVLAVFALDRWARNYVTTRFIDGIKAPTTGGSGETYEAAAYTDEGMRLAMSAGGGVTYVDTLGARFDA